MTPIENQFINYILQYKDSSLITLNNLTDKYFPSYKKEWNFILCHFNQYGNIPDKATFLASFPNFDLIDVQETPQYLIEELFKNFQSSQLAETFNKVRQKLIDGDTKEAVHLYQSAYDNLTTGIALNSFNVLDGKKRYDDYVKKMTDFDKYYVRTGLDELDAIIGGWDRQEELATIVARSGIGKSWMLLKFAIASAQQGLRVGIYSGEMSEEKVGYRIDTLISHLSNGALIHGSSYVQNEYKEYIDTLSTRFKGSIKVLTPLMIGGPAGVNALRAFIEKDQLDILFIDQHSLLDDDRHARNPIERASNISKDLKNLQVMKRIPIISVSQQNRANTDNGVGTENVAQSDRIAQDSTLILFLERRKDDSSILTINIVKARDSVSGKKLSYHVDFNTGLFDFIDEGQLDNLHKSNNQENTLQQVKKIRTDDGEVF